MRSRNPIYPLPKAFSVHINGGHDHVCRYKSYSLERNRVEYARWSKHSGPIIPIRQDLPLPDSRVGALEPRYTV